MRIVIFKGIIVLCINQEILAVVAVEMGFRIW